MTALPDRIAWAIEQLDPSPGDLVLEIGCGRGVAAAAICDRLKRGRYIGLHRSKTAIDAAQKRCADQIAAGKARLSWPRLLKLTADIRASTV
jgi:protein-L-isoaspartate O-methyltransferase